MWKAALAVALLFSTYVMAQEATMERAETRKCGSEAWRMLHPENGDGFSYDTRDVIKGKRVGEMVIHCGKQLPPGRQRDFHIKIAKKYLAEHPEMKIIPPAN